MGLKFAISRQQLRITFLILSLLLFPITMNFLSPYIILYGASQGIINGSFFMFGVLFLSSFVFGRMWCAWLCPAGGLGEVCMLVNNSRIRTKWLDAIKWAIWVVWLGRIAFFAYFAGGFKSVDLIFLTESGISVDAPEKFIIYLMVVGIFLFLALLLGRRAGCHAICWMSPFMIVGRKYAI